MDPHNQNQLLNQRLSRLQAEFILIDHGLCPDWSREEHTRRRDCLYLILDGKGKITVNGNTFYPEKNDMVLLPRGSRVSLYSENETCYNKYWCGFIMSVDGRSLFDVIDFPYMVHLENIDYVKSLFDRLDALHIQTDAASALMIKASLVELVSIFLKNDTHKSTDVKSSVFADETRRFIQENLDSHLTVKALADKMRYNEKYFISLFKKHFGTTPAYYIKTARLEQAKHELLYTDHKSAYIVNKIGYSTAQKFSKDFKAYTGFSPMKFRELFK
ncbi:MAG: AraC family transcriptional regulator [Oscillospiraceae bacterium]|nr:AraC family transcriptional regulator [Oscillospiraceae bacterium]